MGIITKLIGKRKRNNNSFATKIQLPVEEQTVKNLKLKKTSIVVAVDYEKARKRIQREEERNNFNK